MSGPTQTAAIVRLATEQQGMVTWSQLRAAEMSRDAIRSHVDSGWLLRRQRSVYQLGAFPGPFGAEMAALLACGPRAVISHWSSTHVFEITRRAGTVVDVSTLHGIARRRAGIRPHRATSLPACDVVVKHGLRVTTPARTLLDLAASVPRDVLERLTEEVQVLNLASPAEILAVVERGAGRPGVKLLRQVALLLDEPLFTRSEAERRLLELVRAAKLPTPRTNVRLGGWEVDAVWDKQRLVVEVDGYRYHRTRAKFERDRRKDAELMLAGYRVLRITWHRLVSQRDELIALLSAALSAQGRL